MLIGIVNNKLFMQETRPFERAAFIEIVNLMSNLDIAQKDKHGNLVHDDFYKVVVAEVNNKYFGTPIPNWFDREKKRLNRFVEDRKKPVDVNPHYVYEKFHWESDSGFNDIEEDACEYTSDLI